MHATTKQAEDVRRDVMKTYGEAVTASMGKGCCGGAPARKGAVVQLAGYSDAELAGLPTEAVVNSFGCGNPTSLAGLERGEVVLDLGSGAGIDLLLAARKVGPTGRVIGVDMTDEMIAQANKNLRASGLANVEVRKGLIEDLPVESSSVDWVISNCVINLSPEKRKVFGEIARVLKPGGRMLVSDIVVEGLSDTLRQMAGHSSCVKGAISEEEYLGGLRAAGLADVEVRDRFVYDADQLQGFATSALEGLSACAESKAAVQSSARSLAGKVWSAKIYARKPLS